MLAELKSLEERGGEVRITLINTRIIEIPVFYNDPWTRETLMRFRERHQDPNGTDLEYAARINGSTASIGLRRRRMPARRGSCRWWVSSPACRSSTRWSTGRGRSKSPKYLRPRTDTPKLTVGHGGCFGCIYSVRGAGGYQMFGITPMPIYDPNQKISYLHDFMCLFKPGDIVKWKPIDREEYDATVADVEAGRFAPRMRGRDASRSTSFHKDIDGYNAQADGGAQWPLRSSSPGLSTTVQDLGRPGYYHIGIPLSGGMDRFALARRQSAGRQRRRRGGARGGLHGAGARVHRGRDWSR